ncbi:MAG: hypothetical protein A2X36_14410 [Elusimicrobia bacterium GWA2_69_24]|nr:MAG: hypothetical protein A2X36_14410 [Elusimicrobia bacterium GWA2_69_24]HBL18415.1 hypothetical protein [Elusimicrobiota bacterium]
MTGVPPRIEAAVFLKLRVHPGSKKDSIAKTGPDRYEISVRAPAENGRANAACLDLLGRELGVPPRSIRLIKGGKSPSKIVEVLQR